MQVAKNHNSGLTRSARLKNTQGCQAISTGQLAHWIGESSKRYGVSSSLILAVMFQESRFNPCAESPKGAKGMMQLMPGTVQRYAVSNPFDSQTNIDAGTKFLKELMIQFSGDLQLVLAAYNAGPGAVKRAGNVVPDIGETRRYVELLQPVATLVSELKSTQP
jgi:soluble lytic murein transglycosylase-like protein